MRWIDFLLLLVIVLFAPTLRAQVLWQGTAYGMSRAEVQAAVPNAGAPSDPSHFKSGAAELLRVSDFDLVNNKFRASFIFQNEKLIQVNLVLQDEQGLTAETASRAFTDLVTALRMKYGKEISFHRDQGSYLPLASAKVQWLSGRTTIDLDFMVIGHKPFLQIFYRGRLGQEADKF